MNDHILEMRSITKRYPGVVALQDVSLSVREGQIHAICGENGAGKSTLMKVLSGVEPAGSYEGQIVFRDKPVSFASINDSEAEGIVIIHQELALIPYLSVAENIFLGNEQSRGGIISWHETNARASELMARVGLDENPVTPVGFLRSEEHTSELQSRGQLVCRRLLAKELSARRSAGAQAAQD